MLHTILIECAIQLVKFGIHVDTGATDGATWNPSMWTTHENVSCEHICDSSRSLWFLSDFPHLTKTI